MENGEPRILGIDFGLKRIGIAITDPLMMFGYALVTLANDNKLWENLSQIFSEFYIQKIILGMPYKSDGSPPNFSKELEIFKTTIENKFDVSVEFIDERYSSKIAEEQIIASVTSKKKRRDKSLIDKNAAAVLLNDYLENA
ncbi:MAG: Holliday junction resolvase RuvX [Melioribacteraceae bacterium]|nr:Holliday junction resolvase RuvX [Melioribacteraceae bacterium]MCF8263807.1 Holliday junction resolvase RuvX [Melioribacteraceae bacterium]